MIKGIERVIRWIVLVAICSMSFLLGGKFGRAYFVNQKESNSDFTIKIRLFRPDERTQKLNKEFKR